MEKWHERYVSANSHVKGNSTKTTLCYYCTSAIGNDINLALSMFNECMTESVQCMEKK